MDKETLSQYGWVIIIVIILAIMIALASPFGGHLRDSLYSIANNFGEKIGVEATLGDSRTYYTDEEIENDPHLIGMGHTKTNYVVAKFNENYTEAIVTINGEDSDGLVANMPAPPNTGFESVLKKVTFKDGIVSIGENFFHSYTALESVYLPDSVNTISDYAFYNCQSLKNIRLPNNEKVLIGDYAFSESGLTSTKWEGNSTTYIVGRNVFANCKSLKTATMSLNSTLEGGYGLFKGCSNLETITLSSKVTYINPSAEVFSGCTSLKIICGEAGSYAETYANENGYTFKAI